MKLTAEALDIVKENRKCRNALAYKMDVHSGTIDRYVEDNEEDGELTKAIAVEIIHEETGIAKSKILTK